MHTQFKIILFYAILIAAFYLPDSLSSQVTFERTYGGGSQDRGWCAQQTFDGGYIVVGQTKSFGVGGHDVYLIKTDVNGDTLWTRTYGGSGHDTGYFVQQTFDEGYIISGRWDDLFIYLIKTDTHGNKQWSHTYATGAGFSVQNISGGGYVLVGWTSSYGAGATDVYLIKTDANGDTLWTRTYGGSNFDKGHSIQETSDGGYIIAGWTASFGNGGEDVYLVKTDVNGDTLWTRIYGGLYDDRGYSVARTIDGGYIIGGWSASFGTDHSFNSGYDIYLIKTDANGDTLWTQVYGGSDFDWCWAIQQTSDNGYIIVGETKSYGSGDMAVYLIKTDPDGNLQWSRIYYGALMAEGYSVQQTSDEGYVIAGETGDYTYKSRDVLLIKTTYDGLTDIEEELPISIPDKFHMAQNFPNPFNSLTSISYSVLRTSRINLSIYDIKGKVVKRLVNGIVVPGTYFVQWDGIDGHGKAVSSGIYLYRLEADSNFEMTKKMILVK